MRVVYAVVLLACLLAGCVAPPVTPIAESVPTTAPTTEIVAAENGTSENGTTAETADSCRVIIHLAGETEICGEPQRIVALSPHMLDILLSLGEQPAGYAEVEGVGVGAEFGEPSVQIKYIGDRVTSKPINVGTRDNPSLETLVQLAPDLILLEDSQATDVYNTLSQIAPTIAFIGPRHNMWKESIVPIAEALGHPERAQEVIDAHDQRVAQAREELAPLITDNLFLSIAIAGVDSGVVGLSGEQSFGRGLLTELGVSFYPVTEAQQKENDEGGLSLESLAQTDPDSILVLASADNTPERAAQEWADTPVLSN